MRAEFRRCKYWLIAILVLFLTACSAAIMKGGVSSGYSAGGNSATNALKREDDNITAKINTLYVKDDLVSAMSIKVYTYHKVVTLTGRVGSAAEANRAIQLARSASGVQKVVSKLDW